MSFIQCENVVKRYDDLISVDHLSLSINKYEIFGLLGPNGAGKSTAIKMICGLLKADQGQIFVGGVSVKTNSIEVKKSLGLVPQEIAIYENLSARENVKFFGKLYGLRGEELNSKVDLALEFVGLTERKNEKPIKFSGGMKRRLNIACAIVHQPKLIIMDEPTVGIDPQSRNHILESVRKLNEMGSTIIYTSHYMEEIESICTKVGIIDSGRLIALGTVEELIDQNKMEDKITLIVDFVPNEMVFELEIHPKIKNVSVNDQTIQVYLNSSETYLQDILFILSKHDVKVHTLKREDPNLESLFLSLTGRSLRD
ncbi:ABC transporter ATP-binding protein [Chengkuizengella axinellae]|uniref:ABC transporter ATP-binding protein n=1 Tax=Chengkuizengella axinellae TaxID=3064388 RepID=A0ABT9IVE1_9BACL|nr:ABC transporter ATP-binding protein [Chengkuizengella sp. 2205SS18-9]MDP5273303.1 ABC transporter ATP-binding protein [Chengkuizengella sp. 2205SS18-9]